MIRRLRLGLRVNDIDASVKRAIRQAAGLGVRAVELAIDQPEIHPSNISESGRRHLARMVRNQGLELVCLAVPAAPATGTGGAGVGWDQTFARASATLHMARDMQVPLVALPLESRGDARLPGGDSAGVDGDSPRPGDDSVVELLTLLADCADRLSVGAAVRFTGVGCGRACAWLKRVDCPLLGVAMDPSDAILAGDGPDAWVRDLADKLVIAYIRDAVSPQQDRTGYRCRLGRGDLSVTEYLSALSETGLAVPPILRAGGTGHARDGLRADIAYLARSGCLVSR